MAEKRKREDEARLSADDGMWNFVVGQNVMWFHEGHCLQSRYITERELLPEDLCGLYSTATCKVESFELRTKEHLGFTLRILDEDKPYTDLTFSCTINRKEPPYPIADLGRVSASRTREWSLGDYCCYGKWTRRKHGFIMRRRHSPSEWRVLEVAWWNSRRGVYDYTPLRQGTTSFSPWDIYDTDEHDEPSGRLRDSMNPPKKKSKPTDAASSQAMACNCRPCNLDTSSQKCSTPAVSLAVEPTHSPSAAVSAVALPSNSPAVACVAASSFHPFTLSLPSNTTTTAASTASSTTATTTPTTSTATAPVTPEIAQVAAAFGDNYSNPSTPPKSTTAVDASSEYSTPSPVQPASPLAGTSQSVQAVKSGVNAALSAHHQRDAILLAREVLSSQERIRRLEASQAWLEGQLAAAEQAVKDATARATKQTTCARDALRAAVAATVAAAEEKQTLTARATRVERELAAAAENNRNLTARAARVERELAAVAEDKRILTARVTRAEQELVAVAEAAAEDKRTLTARATRAEQDLKTVTQLAAAQAQTAVAETKEKLQAAQRRLALTCNVAWVMTPKGFMPAASDADSCCNIQTVVSLFENGGRGCRPFNQYRIERIESVFNYPCIRALNTKLDTLNVRRGGNGQVALAAFATEPLRRTEQKHVVAYLKNLFVRSCPYERSNVMLLWHGCAARAVNDIVATGCADLRHRDAGFFGAGIYLTPHSEYAAKYSRGLSGPALPPNDRGEYVMLLCAVAVGMAYPVTRDVDYQEGAQYSNFYSQGGVGLRSAYDAHAAFVAIDEGFQATTIDRHDFLEVVVKEEAQVLPLYKVFFKRA